TSIVIAERSAVSSPTARADSASSLSGLPKSARILATSAEISSAEASPPWNRSSTVADMVKVILPIPPPTNAEPPPFPLFFPLPFRGPGPEAVTRRVPQRAGSQVATAGPGGLPARRSGGRWRRSGGTRRGRVVAAGTGPLQDATVELT